MKTRGIPIGKLTDFSPGGTPAWSYPIEFLIILGTSLLMLKGLGGAGASTFRVGAIFFMMYFFSFALLFFSSRGSPGQRRFLGIGNDPLGELATILVGGFIAWYGLLATQDLGFLGGLTASIVPQIPINALLSTNTGTLSQPTAYFVNGIVAPVVEEKFFGAAIPLILLGIYDVAGVENRFIRLSTILLIPGALFASFHLASPAFSAFWWGALIFAVVIRGIVFADFNYNIVPGVAVFFSFMWGAHIANNVYQLGGIVHFVQVLSQDFILFAITMSVAGFYVFFALRYLYNKFAPAVEVLGGLR